MASNAPHTAQSSFLYVSTSGEHRILMEKEILMVRVLLFLEGW